jgi:mannose/fructose/N-acetylgalactosamine-specific phosphotransferase system component IID
MATQMAPFQAEAARDSKNDIPFGPRILGATGVGALVATVINVTLYGAARLVGIPMRGVFHEELGVTVLPLSTVVTYSVLPALLGGAVFALLVRFFQKGTEVFLGIATALSGML